MVNVQTFGSPSGAARKTRRRIVSHHAVVLSASGIGVRSASRRIRSRAAVSQVGVPAAVLRVESDREPEQHQPREPPHQLRGRAVREGGGCRLRSGSGRRAPAAPTVGWRTGTSPRRRGHTGARIARQCTSESSALRPDAGLAVDVLALVPVHSVIVDESNDPVGEEMLQHEPGERAPQYDSRSRCAG